MKSHDASSAKNLSPLLIPCLFLLVEWILLYTTAEKPPNRKIRYMINITFPVHTYTKQKIDDAYLCKIKKLNFTQEAVYIDTFSYEFPKNVHHFLLYGCEEVSKPLQDDYQWSCHEEKFLCTNRKQIPLGIPQENSSESNKRNLAKFPPNVAYAIGKKFGINYLLLEIHIMKLQESGENTKINSTDAYQNYKDIRVTAEVGVDRPKYLGGMLVMAAAGFRIPPGREKFSIDINCQPKISQPLFPYGYWVHTHDFGKVVSGYIVNKTSGNFIEIARWTHHWPQPVLINTTDQEKAIRPGNYLAGRCTYNTSTTKDFIDWGPHRKLNEMCNLFLFYYTASSGKPEDLSISCVNEQFRQLSKHFPNNSDVLPESKVHAFNLLSNDKRKNVTFLQFLDVSPVCKLYNIFGIKNCPFN